MTNLTESQQTVTVATVPQRVKELEPMFQANGKITVGPREGKGVGMGGVAMIVPQKRGNVHISVTVVSSYSICWMTP